MGHACPGHCPHHETPSAVNDLITRWIKKCEDKDHLALVQEDFAAEYVEVGGVRVTAKAVDGAPRSLFEKLLAAFDLGTTM
jgi:hypothetical protein